MNRDHFSFIFLFHDKAGKGNDYKAFKLFNELRELGVKAANIYLTMVDTFPDAGYQLGLMYKRGILNSPFMPDYFIAEKYFRISQTIN